MLTQKDYGEGSSGEQLSYTSSVETRVCKTFGASSISEIIYPNSHAFPDIGCSTNDRVDMESNYRNLGADIETNVVDQYNSTASTKSEQVNCFKHFLG